MGKQDREKVKELGTKQNLESWLQHKDKPEDKDQSWLFTQPL